MNQELYYTADNKLMAVEVKTTPTFDYGVPKELFQTQVLRAGGFTLVFQYDVAPDGRFLVLNNAGSGSANSSPITVVLNWTAGLGR